MSEDLRCCGSGTCMINAAGVCWCGQRWDGDRMCSPGQPTEPIDAMRPQDSGVLNSPAQVTDPLVTDPLRR